MTSPIDDPNAPVPVSILGRIFGRVQKAPSPPANLEDRLSYTDQTGSLGTEAAFWKEGDVPSLDDGYFPTIRQQDELLTHWERPPADQNPQAWYDDRNIWAKDQRDNREILNGTPIPVDTRKAGEMAADPKWTPPTINRPTAFLSPSSYRYTRAFGQDVDHEFTGVHLSLADNRRAYNLAGNVGRTDTWNNSYRLDPISNDASAVFVGDTVQNQVDTTIIYSQNSQPTTKSSYRL